MKNIALLSSCLLLTAFSYSQSFTLSGDTRALPVAIERVFLYYLSATGDQVSDSTAVVNGKYTFKGSLTGPVTAYLQAVRKPGASPIEDRLADSGKIYRAQIRAHQIKTLPADFAARERALFMRYEYQVFLLPSKIEVIHTGTFSHADVAGDPFQDEFVRLNRASDSYDSIHIRPLTDSMRIYQANGDTANYARLDHETDAENNRKGATLFLDYARAHPSSPLAIYALGNAAGYPFNGALLEPVFNQLSDSIRNSPAGRQLAGQINTALVTSIGRPALDFTMNDTLGHPVSLSSFRGKYVLLDFWASWCMPCRAANPGIARTFRQFRDKGFTILSVSLDRPNGKAAWLKAIHDDQLAWTHVSDLKFWNNAAAKLYNIQGIPDNLLIDPAGIIIGRNFDGDQLSQRLSEIWKN